MYLSFHNYNNKEYYGTVGAHASCIRQATADSLFELEASQITKNYRPQVELRNAQCQHPIDEVGWIGETTTLNGLGKLHIHVDTVTERAWNRIVTAVCEVEVGLQDQRSTDNINI